MIGAIVATAVLAALSSLASKLGKFAMWRDFPNFSLNVTSDFLMDAELAIRFMQYRMLTRLFHLQALVLWWGFALLLAVYLLAPFVGKLL